MPKEGCKHSGRTKIDGPFGIHDYKMVCSDCGKFIEFFPKDIESKKRLNRYTDIYMMLRSKLTPFEESFLKSVYKLDELSPKQEALYLKIKNSIFPEKNNK